MSLLISIMLAVSLVHAKDEELKRVDKIDLSKFSVETSRTCGVSIKNNKLILDKSTASYYAKLSELDKKIYIRLAALDFLKKDVNQKPYMYVYKQDGLIYLESLAHVKLPFSEALPVVTGFQDYHSWLLKDINVRRGGKGGTYFLEILTMTYRERGKYWDFLIKLNSVLGGLYTVAFNIEDRLKETPVPSLGLHIRESSTLAKTMNGYFRFLRMPCDDTFFIGYFYGDTKLHWLLYNFLSVDIVNSQVGERVETMLENINYKAEDVMVQNMRSRSGRNMQAKNR